MKTSEILNAVLNGGKILVGEYRGFEARNLPNGTTIICSNYVVVGRDSLPVESFAPKGATIEQAKALAPAGIKVGDRVVIDWTELSRDKYGTHCRGTVHALTKD